MTLLKVKLIIVGLAFVTLFSCSVEDDGIYFKEINQIENNEFTQDLVQ